MKRSIEELKDLLHEYLDKGFIKWKKSMIVSHSCSKFQNNFPDLIDRIIVRTDQIKSLKEILDQYAPYIEKNGKKVKITDKDVCDLLSMPKGVLDRIRNQLRVFSAQDKNKIFSIAVCYKLNKSQAKRVLTAAHIVLRPKELLPDAVFDFVVSKCEYVDAFEKNIAKFGILNDEAEKYVKEQLHI